MRYQQDEDVKKMQEISATPSGRLNRNKRDKRYSLLLHKRQLGKLRKRYHTMKNTGSSGFKREFV